MSSNVTTLDSTPLHRAITGNKDYIDNVEKSTSLNNIVVRPSVMYSQAVLRPSLALAQGHALSLIQGLKVKVNEWNVSKAIPGFEVGIRSMISDLEKAATLQELVCSVETGVSNTKRQQSVETLRLCVRSDIDVLFVALYAGGTILTHDLGWETGVDITTKFCQTFEPREKGYINHLSLTQEGIKSTRYENKDEGDIIDEAYPQVDGMSEFVNKYLNGSSSILNLYGLPGTGKSTLLRKIASRATERHTMIVDDPTIYSQGASALMSHIREVCGSGKPVLLLLEEVDSYIKEKSVENSFLVQLLSMSSGVLPMDVKIVLASNLTNSDKFLAPLTRAGRSFGTIEFSKLTKEQVVACRIALNLDPEGYDKSMTLAEAICEKVVKVGTDHNRVGFLG